MHLAIDSHHITTIRHFAMRPSGLFTPMVDESSTNVTHHVSNFQGQGLAPIAYGGVTLCQQHVEATLTRNRHLESKHNGHHTTF